MGIQYFYTWITTRYPLIKRTYDPEIAPQTDHLYLDLNGVLHRCAKESDVLFKDVLCGKKMERIFVEILNYINFVVNLIRPKKSLMISIDGVAPRSKTLDQRNRRFIRSKEQKELDEFLRYNLTMESGVINFKNNSITPGTDFMITLNKHIDFFIRRKLVEDLNWKDLKIYFSGGDVPGEGEHKILDFIRGWKQSKDFDLEDAHCIYGNDSDLVLLSLVTHLPNVMVFREKNQYHDREVVNSATNRHKKP